MFAPNNSVLQLQTTMNDAVSALERGLTAADVRPSRLYLPPCTAEAYEDFVRLLITETMLAEKARICLPIHDKRRQQVFKCHTAYFRRCSNIYAFAKPSYIKTLLPARTPQAECSSRAFK
nr:unnamed protein product [Spirometra erinaceieuropaei]